MNCPVCGLEPLSDQKFCRKCGASLWPATQPPAQITVENPQQHTHTPEGVRSLTGILVRTGFIMMFVGILLGVTGERVFNIETVTIIGALLAITGIFMVGYSSAFRPSRRRRMRSPKLPTQPEVLAAAETTKKLPQMSDIDFVPASVTEGTTDLLKTPAANSRET